VVIQVENDQKDSNVEETSSRITSKTIVTSTPKKRGRKKGATGYTNGDIKAVLDSVEFILPIMDNEWDFVSKHYNETYSSQYERPERSALALKSKFRDLCHGPPTGGGSRTKYESRAKEIEGFIDSKAGIIINDVDSDEYLDNDESIDELQQKTKVKKKEKPEKKRPRSRMDFEKQVMTFLTESSKLENEQAQKRHDEKMELFRMFLQNRSNQQQTNNEE
jgi:hypothetical protein